jgi:Xaa-Pro aminopeptidase
MRRGLIAWSNEELPEAVLDKRVGAVQHAMAAAGLDAVVAYTTPARAGAVSWLAGFVPYWNQGLLVVPRAGRPVLVSALSNRVNDWMRRNAHVADVKNSPRIGGEAGKLIAGFCGKANVGVVDLPHLPAAVIEEIGAEGHSIADASALFRTARAVPDDADLALHERAAAIGQGALAGVDPRERDAARLIAAIDGEARRHGAEEAYPALACDLARSRRLVRLEGSAPLGEMFAVRLSLAYKGAWVRITRTFARGDAGRAAIAAAEERFQAMIAALPDTHALAQSASFIIEGTRTALPLEPLAGTMIEEPEPLVAGSIVTVSATLETDGVPVLAGAPVHMTAPPLLLGARA